MWMALERHFSMGKSLKKMALDRNSNGGTCVIKMQILHLGHSQKSVASLSF